MQELSICISIFLSIYPSICISVYLSLCLSMAVQTFVGPWPLFRFLDFSPVGRTPWTRDQPVARSLSHTGQHKQNKRTQKSMPQVGYKPTIPVFQRVKTFHALDRAATVIGKYRNCYSICFKITIFSIVAPSR
jgi:hypothetical protein